MNKSISLTDLSSALPDLVASVAPSVVAVRSDRSRSSGFVWRAGLIVTADESLSEEGAFSVTLHGGSTVAAHLVGRDPTTDKMRSCGSTPIFRRLQSGNRLWPWARLFWLSAPRYGTSTAALGVVSRARGPWRSLRGGEIDSRIELDLRLPQTAEGGLVIDVAGTAIGMAVFGPRRRVLVIPTATIKRVAPKLAEHGRIARGYLGLGLQPVTIEGDEGLGVMIMSVDPQGPGARAGLHQGDILIDWNGEPIRHVQSLLRALGPDSVGQPVTLGLRRAGDRRQVSLTIGERPST
jgi:S1-C subfamily serine protease